MADESGCDDCAVEGLIGLLYAKEIIDSILWAQVEPVAAVDALISGAYRARACFLAAEGA